MGMVGQQLFGPGPGWKRYDDSDGRITYTGTWDYATGTSVTYNGTQHTTTSLGKCSFKFYGTKLRLVCTTASNNDSDITVKIDGVIYKYSGYSDVLMRMVLAFEKVDLALGNHTVEIYGNNNGLYICVDAIDIDDTGELVAVGVIQTAPESGWRRYDDNDARITKNGTWGYEVLAGEYGGGANFTTSPTATMTFSFYGTKLRIINGYWNNKRTDNIINIDGVDYTFSEYMNITANCPYQSVVFEKAGLPIGFHTVTISSPNLQTGENIQIDAIDIDSTGYLLGIGPILSAPDPGWRRYDDRDTRFKYTGTWNQGAFSTGTATYYNLTDMYVPVGVLTTEASHNIKFSFYGTRIRLMGYRNTIGCVNCFIVIDGVTYPFTQLGTASTQGCINFEKVGLTNGVHSVEIYGVNTDSTHYGVVFDCIDIDDTGDLMGTGLTLATPETGWRRYDDTDSRIIYDGLWIYKYASDSGHYGGTYSSTYMYDAKLTFKFYGSKLRILSSISTYRDSNIKITVDGVTYSFSEYSANSLNKILVFEKLNLGLGVHVVTMTKGTNDTSLWMNFDALDIDSDGYLMHPILNQVSDILSMQEGDCLPCRYTATMAGIPGVISEVGTCTMNEIPVSNTATTSDGLFYLVKSENGLLLADRTVQGAISWESLEARRLVEGCMSKLEPTKVVLRLNTSNFKDDLNHPIVGSNAVTLDTTLLKSGQGSASFNGSSSYLQYTLCDDLNFGNRDFFMEVTAYVKSWSGIHRFFAIGSDTAYSNIFLGCGDGWSGKGNVLNFGYRNPGNTAYVDYYSNTSLPVVANSWYTFAVARKNNVLTFYINGTIVGTVAITDSIYCNDNQFYVGTRTSGSSKIEYFNGNIHQIRIVNGSSVYNGLAYNPEVDVPANLLNNLPVHMCRLLTGGNAYLDYGYKRKVALLMPCTGDFTDLSSGQKILIAGTTTKATPTGIVFDGTTNSTVTIQNYTSDLDFFNLDFTIEMFVTFNSIHTATYDVLMDWRSNTSANYPLFYLWNGQFSFTSTNAGIMKHQTVLATGVEYHLAVCRKNGIITLFVNGVPSSSAINDSATYYAPPKIILGNDYTNALMLNGKIRGIRIIKGNAEYTGAFTPPTSISTDTEDTLLHPLRSNVSCGFGCWPAHNEYDRLIRFSNLKGKIKPGDINVWHSFAWTWCQETPASNVTMVSAYSNANRVARGCATPPGATIPPTNDIERYSNSRMNSVGTTYTDSNGGYRPVIEYIEQDSKQTNLFY